jgi:putative Holliday junction resolvase
LGLDFGEKTIGVAISHNGRVAVGVKTIFRKASDAFRPSLKELKQIIREHEIFNIVLGYPKHLNDDESARCAETLAFKEKLGRYVKNLNIILWDERFSTKAVSRVKNGSRKNAVDEMAAVYILQGYLDYINGKESPMISEKFDDFDDEDGGSLMIVTEDGEERPLQILSSCEESGSIFLLAVEENDGDVFHFKCQPAQDDEDDVILEQIDKDHEDYERVFAMFKNEYEDLGIDIEDIA